MKTLVVSSSLDSQSRSEEMARMCEELLRSGSEVSLITLKDYPLHGRDLHRPLESDAYRKLHAFIAEADGIVLASPVYNWGCCAELKRLIEVVGSTPPDGSLQSPFFDKVVAFVNSAGLPHSYMAFSGIAMALVLDFKCVLSPYNVYVTDRDWDSGKLSQASTERVSKSMDVFLQLTSLLKARTYKSGWEI